MERTREEISHYLSNEEKILIVIRQSYLSSVSPDEVVATDKKILVIRHSFWGLHTRVNILSSTNVGVVLYKDVVSMEALRGKLFTTLRFHLGGTVSLNGASENLWTIDGLRRNDATEFMSRVAKILEESAKLPERGNPT